jgi:hypothetical protein
MWKWTVNVGFSDLSQCKPHDPMRPCEKCRPTMGSREIDVFSETSSAAVCLAVDHFGKEIQFGILPLWSVVSADIVGWAKPDRISGKLTSFLKKRPAKKKAKPTRARKR